MRRLQRRPREELGGDRDAVTRALVEDVTEQALRKALAAVSAGGRSRDRLGRGSRTGTQIIRERIRELEREESGQHDRAVRQAGDSNGDANGIPAQEVEKRWIAEWDEAGLFRARSG